MWPVFPAIASPIAPRNNCNRSGKSRSNLLTWIYNDDYAFGQFGMNNQSSLWMIPALLALGAGAALWYYWEQVEKPRPEPVSVPREPERAAEEPTLPRYPVAPAIPERSAAENLMPLPPLNESDRYFELAMVDVFGSGIDDMLVDTALIEKIVATVDNLPRSQVAERIRPVSGVLGPFSADGQDGSGQYTVNPANYQRYDFLVNLLATADLEVLVDTYRRFYPLFQEAYVNLGYPQGYFNDRVVEVIDHLLETPEIDEPVELLRPHVLYEYADPELEALSSGQKLILRTGSEHAVRIKQFLEELRELIGSADPPSRRE